MLRFVISSDLIASVKEKERMTVNNAAFILRDIAHEHSVSRQTGTSLQLLTR